MMEYKSLNIIKWTGSTNPHFLTASQLEIKILIFNTKFWTYIFTVFNTLLFCSWILQSGVYNLNFLIFPFIWNKIMQLNVYILPTCQTNVKQTFINSEMVYLNCNIIISTFIYFNKDFKITEYFSARELKGIFQLVVWVPHYHNSATGTGTKFVAYLSSSPTF